MLRVRRELGGKGGEGEGGEGGTGIDAQTIILCTYNTCYRQTYVPRDLLQVLDCKEKHVAGHIRG